MSQVSKFTKYVKWYHVNYVNGHHVNIFMFYHVKFEVIGKYFLSCKLIFVLEKERKIFVMLLTSLVMHAYVGMCRSSRRNGSYPTDPATSVLCSGLTRMGRRRCGGLMV